MLFPVWKAGGFLETGVCLLVKEAQPKAPLVPMTLGLEDEKGKR